VHDIYRVVIMVPVAYVVTARSPEEAKGRAASYAKIGVKGERFDGKVNVLALERLPK
jgi:hypothetical protein